MRLVPADNPGMEIHPKRWDLSTSVLVLANATPLFGVFFLHWHVFPLLLLYWIENVIVGVFNVLRMLIADPDDPAAWLVKLFMIPFFCVHYGMFTFVHGIFVYGLFGGNKLPMGTPIELATQVSGAIPRLGLGFAVLSIAASHTFSFLVNFIHGGEYRHVSLSQLMSQPYARVVVMHLTILGGAFLMMALGSPVYGLMVLVGIKTGVDVAAHRAERRKLGEPRLPGKMVQPARVA